MEISKVYNSLSLSELLESTDLTSELKQRITQELMQELMLIIYKFTGGDSSVSKERAQSLMDSLEYTMSYYLRHLTLDEAIFELQRLDIHTLYQKSYAYLLQQLHQLYIRVQALQELQIDIPVIIYQATIQDGLDAFFTAYNFDYCSQDIVLTLDYPTCQHIMKQGFEKLEDYVSFLEIEHHFLACFPINELKICIQGFDYYDQGMIENLSFMVMTQLLMSSLIYHTENCLKIQKQALQKLYTYFIGKSPKEIEQLLRHQLQICIRQLNTPDYIEIYNYYQAILPDLASMLNNHIQYRTLHHFLSLE